MNVSHKINSNSQQTENGCYTCRTVETRTIWLLGYRNKLLWSTGKPFHQHIITDKLKITSCEIYDWPAYINLHLTVMHNGYFNVSYFNFCRTARYNWETKTNYVCITSRVRQWKYIQVFILQEASNSKISVLSNVDRSSVNACCVFSVRSCHNASD